MKIKKIVPLILLTLFSFGVALGAPPLSRMSSTPGLSAKRIDWAKVAGELKLKGSQKSQFEAILLAAHAQAKTIAVNSKLSKKQRSKEFGDLRTVTIGQVRMLLTSKQQILLNLALRKP